MKYEILEQVIAAKGIRKNWLASKAGIDNWWLSRYLHGSYDMPEDVKQRIADALDIPVSILFSEKVA